jgi:hypothetical protein
VRVVDTIEDTRRRAGADPTPRVRVVDAIEDTRRRAGADRTPRVRVSTPSRTLGTDVSGRSRAFRALLELERLELESP